MLDFVDLVYDVTGIRCPTIRWRNTLSSRTICTVMLYSNECSSKSLSKQNRSRVLFVCACLLVYGKILIVVLLANVSPYCKFFFLKFDLFNSFVCSKCHKNFHKNWPQFRFEVRSFKYSNYLKKWYLCNPSIKECGMMMIN